ncbi:MAG TPA: hypothetical protein VNN12_07495 [Dehalococcoidia bacterium]|nr:hypothetical protein [Dehalococcoidia bacterium]
MRLPRLPARARGLVPRIATAACAVVAGVALGVTRPDDSPYDGAGDASAVAYNFGVENSWIRVQNIGTLPTNPQVDYFDENGRLVASDVCPKLYVCPTLQPGEGWTFFQKLNPGLPGGFRGSATVTSEQPVVALQARDVIRNGRFSIAGDTTTPTEGAHVVYLPLVASQDGPDRGWNSRFVVQNLGQTTACVTITYFSNYTDGPVKYDPYDPSEKRPRRLSGCPKGGRPIPPGGSLFRDPQTMGVGPGFTGSVRITTHTNGNGDDPDEQFITAMADQYHAVYSHFASYRGLSEAELGRSLILPLIDREVGPLNQWSTHFQIVNKDPKKPASVTLVFEGYDLNAGGAFVVKRNTIEVKAARLCLQERDDYANCLAPGDRLPVNFVGTVKITSTQPVGVIVNRNSKYQDVFTNYRAIRPEDGGRKVLLPVLNKNYGPVGAAHGWNSWFRVMVTDGGVANVTIRYFGRDLPNGSVAYTMTVNREATVFQYLEPALPDGFAGTAILESDRPIAAVANLTTDVFVGDPDLLYNGVTIP